MQDTPQKGMSRRNLLAGIGAGAGLGGLLTASAAQAALLPQPAAAENFDVVVIGTGMAGCAAALEAASRGARVAVVEKSAESRAGGNSLLAGGYFAMPRTDAQADRDAYLEDFIKKGLGRGNREIYELMTANARADVAWLAANGIEFLPEADMPPYRVAAALVAPGAYMGMPRMMKNLRQTIAGKGAVFFYDTKARQLVMNERGAVAGVRCVGNNGVVDYAAHAVVVAAGGYGGNTQILEAYSDPNAGAMMVRGVPWATGDGLTMALAAGAGLKGMGGLGALHVAAVDELETAAGNPFAALPHGLAVNREGRRFIDESRGYVAHGKAVLGQPGQRSTLIFDEKVKALPGPASALATFQRLGIRTYEADTLEELAAAVGIPAEALVETVRAFNEAVEGEAAPGANPPKAGLALRIDTPKFYAFHPLAPGITLTFGGIMIDARARVLEPDGRVIPGLFAAGEGAGAVFFDDYVGGGSLTNCLVMGRVAGREATAT